MSLVIFNFWYIQFKVSPSIWTVLHHGECLNLCDPNKCLQAAACSLLSPLVAPLHSGPCTSPQTEIRALTRRRIGGCHLCISLLFLYDWVKEELMGKCPFVHLASPASLPTRYGLCVLAVDLQYTVKTLAALATFRWGSQGQGKCAQTKGRKLNRCD